MIKKFGLYSLSIVAMLLLATITVSCAANYTATETEAVQAAQARLDQIQEELNTSEVSVEQKAELKQEQYQIEENLAKLEKEVLRRQAGPIVAALAGISPHLAAFSPFLLGLIPLLGKRGRTHAWNLTKAVIPGVQGPRGNKYPDPVAAMDSLRKYLGATHSETGTVNPLA